MYVRYAGVSNYIIRHVGCGTNAGSYFLKKKKKKSRKEREKEALRNIDACMCALRVCVCVFPQGPSQLPYPRVPSHGHWTNR